MEKHALIALGANLRSTVGAPKDTLVKALEILEKIDVRIGKVSCLYNTPAFPAGNGPDFVNAAASIHFSGSALQILRVLHEVEARMGRKRDTRWGQRTLDLDLIACADLILPDLQTQSDWRDMPLSEQVSRTPDQLILPHPRMQDRAFVLVPLADIAADWRHPVTQKSVIQMRDALPKSEIAAVRRIDTA